MAVLKRRESTREGDRYTINGIDHVVVISYRQDLYVSVNGRGSDHPFHSAGFSGSGALHYGKLGAVNDFNGAPSGLYASVLPWIGNGLPGPPASVAALLAGTNPATPDVQLPVFAFELKDLPDMLRQAGLIARRIYFERGSWSNLIRPGHVIEDTASANLAIQFGWRPFVSDLWKIISFQNSVEKRRKQLQKLKSGKGMVATRHFGTQRADETWSAVANSDYGAFVSTQVNLTHTCEVWGVARWKPTAGVEIPVSDGALLRQVTGLSPDAILTNVWEALPWSWLADWFTGIGNIIQAGNRTIATPVSACIMRRRRTKATSMPRRIDQDPSHPYVLEAGQFTWWDHERSISGGFTDTALLPTLGANQLSILGSLAVTRGR